MGDSSRTTTLVRPSQVVQQDPSGEVILNRYRVLSRCGTGGFGTVCVSWDTRLQRRVAIKRIPLINGIDSRGVLASTVGEALAEARTACLLAHPNIVTVYDFEQDGRYAYLVMEYVDGLNLSELLSRVEGGTLTYAEVAHVLESVADALAYAHENGALHLDIKPTNIMIDRSGTVKLTDFGMATLASAAGYGDARGGTVGYMPPEQIQGMLVDERSDIFSLAVVLWQAITGKNPFAADSAKTSLVMINHGPKPALSSTDPGLAGAPEDALMQALSPDPTNRYSDVLDFAEDLGSGLGDPADGEASLRRLISQSEEDDDIDDEDWEVRHLPLRLRFPWLGAVVNRLVAAACVFWVAHLALPPAVLDNRAALIASGVMAAVTLAWPPLGSVLSAAAVVFAVSTVRATVSTFPLAAIIGVALAGWWIAFGHRDHLATPALLAPCCLPSPLAGVGLAAYALEPLSAMVTAFVGCLLGTYFPIAVASGFAAQPTLYTLLQALAHLGPWVGAIGAALAAGVGSAITSRGTVASGVVGQIVTALLLGISQVAAARVENTSIWAVPDVGTLVIGVGLCVLLCFACALRGPLDWDQEGDDYE